MGGHHGRHPEIARLPQQPGRGWGVFDTKAGPVAVVNLIGRCDMPFGPDNPKPLFCTLHVYDYGTSKVVGREQEHIKLELVDNKSNNVMNGIAFGQSSQARYIKTKRSFDICYTIEENTHKRGEVQLQIEDIRPSGTE